MALRGLRRSGRAGAGRARLTLRGRCFLTAGLAALSCAVVLGQPSLVRVAVLVVALPLIAALVVGRGRHHLALGREVTPARVRVGQSATVRLRVVDERRSGLSRGVLLLEDEVPYVLGSRPRFVLAGLAAGVGRDLAYPVRSDVRGHFEVGPLHVRTRDPFGLVEVGRVFRGTAGVVVTPPVVELSPISFGGGWSGAGDNRPRPFATGSAEDVTVREYRTGDDLRRVHWRSSARAGELMVRREEQPWQARATVFLDDRARSHRGSGLASSLEPAVVAAASVAAHLTRRGYAVRLATASGTTAVAGWHQRAATAELDPVLEALAVVALAPASGVDTSWLRDEQGDGLVVAVLGRTDHHDQPVLRRLAHHGDAALALLVDTGPGDEPADRRVLALGTQGWRAAHVGPDQRLEDAWRRLAGGRPATGPGRAAPTPASAPGGAR